MEPGRIPAGSDSRTARVRIVSLLFAILTPLWIVIDPSVFPLTLAEGIAFAFPVLAAQGAVAVINLDSLEWTTHAGAFWLLMLITIVATLAGMSQLHMIAALIEQSSHDLLTGVFNRRSGEVILDLHARQAARRHAPWAIAFFDLDKFKRVNDVYGHDAGDECLNNAAAALSEAVRNTDIVIRWGGEEFVLLMPDTDETGAHEVLMRICKLGLGQRPDGAVQTASVGIAISKKGAEADWRTLVEEADRHMYEAKRAGGGQAYCRILGTIEARPVD